MPEFMDGSTVTAGNYFIKPETGGSGHALLRFGLVVHPTQDAVKVQMAGLRAPTKMQAETFRLCLKVDASVLPPGTQRTILGGWGRMVE